MCGSVFMLGVPIRENELLNFAINALRQVGVNAVDANTVASALVDTDLRGVASHGISALSGYINHLERGGVKGNAVPRILAQGPAFASIDGESAFGPVVAKFAAELAIEKARIAGVGLVTARNSNHFGAAAVYALMIAEAGMIGQVVSNTPPLMAPTGGRGRKIGTNPIAVAAPAGKHPAFVLDMATATAALGKIVNAAAKGATIPEGWMLSPCGAATDDPRQFQEGGALIPFGDYKGYGISLVVEILSGVLAGAGILDEVTSWRREPDQESRTGHSFLAINIEAFMPLGDFKQRMDRMIDAMHETPLAVEAERIFVAGEIEAQNTECFRAEGIVLSEVTLGDLNALADRLRISRPKLGD